MVTGHTRTQQIEHRIGETGTFALRVTNWDVELRESADDTARVNVIFEIRAAGDGEADEIFERAKCRVVAASDSLEVTEPSRSETGFGALARLLGGREQVEATVVAEVPARARVTVAAVSAELTVRGLTGTQEYRTVSGDAVLSGTAGQVRINSVSGDLSLRGVGPTALDANSVSGDVTAFAPRFERTRVVTVSGDVELEGELAEAGEHRFETVSGDLSLGVVNDLSLEVRGLSSDVSVSLPHRSEGSRDRRRYVVGNGGATVVFSSMSGDVSVASARRYESRVGAPRPPVPPAPPSPPTPARAPAPTVDDATQLAVLRALERGEIDVEEASRRLAGASDG